MDLFTMTPAQLLATAHAARLSVTAQDGRLVVRGPKRVEGLARHLVRRKVELLPLVQSCAAAPAINPTPAWDQAEAERLLATVREAFSRVEANVAAGKAPLVRLAVLRIWHEVAEEYVRSREVEARRSWNALELLRSVGHRCTAAAGLSVKG